MADIAQQISSSLDALTQEFNIVAHNLANVSTVGYKRRCNTFSQSLEAQEKKAQGASSEDINFKSTFDFSQGNMVSTENPLDFALYGQGFFLVETTEGPLYTRNGMFHLNQNGQIADSMGRIIAGDSGPITVPNTAGISQINVSSDGNISANGISIGKFKLVDFRENQAKLVPAGEGCFRMTDTSIQPADAENLIVKQGFQEASNVKIIDELVDMIMVSRLYESNMKFVSAKKDTSSSLMGVAMG